VGGLLQQLLVEVSFERFAKKMGHYAICNQASVSSGPRDMASRKSTQARFLKRIKSMATSTYTTP